MTESEYQSIQEALRKKLKSNPYARHSYRAEEGYEKGILAAMSILHSFREKQKGGSSE